MTKCVEGATGWCGVGHGSAQNFVAFLIVAVVALLIFFILFLFWRRKQQKLSK